MTATNNEPWRGLNSAVADVIEPVMGTAGSEIIESIGREIPEYARPLEGEFGRNLRTGVREALEQFVALIRDPETGRGTGRAVYVQLGEGEFRQGRALDALQAAYRIGARVAWRRAAEAGRDSGMQPEALAILAESMFAYIDELSADSVEGYARAQSESEGERQRRRRELVSGLMSHAQPDAAAVRKLASVAQWDLPRSLAPLVCSEAGSASLARGLGSDCLAATREGLGLLLLPDPLGPGRRDVISRAIARTQEHATVGPSVAIGGVEDGLTLPGSWRIAAAVHRRGKGPLFIDDDPLSGLVADSADILGRISHQALAPLGELSPRARERMLSTLWAYASCGGNATAMARQMGVHTQTARYRINRLREAFGDGLDDPLRRLELMLAVRHHTDAADDHAN